MKIDKNIFIIAGIIVLAALSRLIPHAPNFTAVGAIALFGAAYFKDKRIALIVPFIALWISDVLLNHFIYGSYYHGLNAWFGNEFTYLGFIAIVFMGMPLLKKVTISSVFGSSILASLVFFLISNFGVWLGSTIYPKDMTGLIMTYSAGIPFFWNTLAANLIFSTVLFGTYEWGIKPYLEVKSART